MAVHTQKVSLYDSKTALVAEKDIELEEPYFHGQGWRLPAAVLHEGRFFVKVGEDTYAEKAREVKLVNTDGTSEMVKVFHPLPGIIAKNGKHYHKNNEDRYDERSILAL